MKTNTKKKKTFCSNILVANTIIAVVVVAGVVAVVSAEKKLYGSGCKKKMKRQTES